MKEQIKYTLFLTLFLYIFLYAPLIKWIPIPTPLFLLPITYWYLSRSNHLSKFLFLFKSELILLSLLLIYVLISDLYFGGNVYFTHVFYYIFDVFPTSFIIVTVFLKDASRESFFKLLIYIGTIAATISVLAFMIPPFNELILLLLNNENFVSSELGRNFGFASGLLYAYPIGQGFIAVVCLIMSKESKRYLISFLLIFISITINARTGLFPILLYLAISILKFNFKTLISIALFVTAFIVANNLGAFAPIQDLVDWNLSMFFDISNQFFGTDIGQYGDNATWFEFIVENFLVFPTNIFDWIFGEHRLIFLDPLKNSDMGYINDLIYGGLILVSLISLFFMKLTKRLLHDVKDNESRIISILIIGIYLITNLKGEFFRPSPGNRILILTYVYLIYSSHALNTCSTEINKLEE